MTEVVLSRQHYLELEKLAWGAFRPLTGFMNEDDFRSSVARMRLASGEPFPIPVVLDVDVATARAARGAPSVALVYGGEQVGSLVPESVFTCDLADVAGQVFGTGDPAHPGVRFFLGGGDHFLGGPVTLLRRAAFEFSAREIEPEGARAIFRERGWKRIAGFQTRNVPHRAHEHLQRTALEHVDGLFIQPLVGRRNRGDYAPGAILRGYDALIADYFRPERVVLGILSTAMRYAGPREAVFHAIVRRNYGCTHFVVGRDHAGVGDYYPKYGAHELVRRFDGELGIEVMCLHGPFYCRRCDSIATEWTCPHWDADPGAVTEISGTDMRAILSSGREPDPHLMRPEVVAALRGIPVFVEQDDP